MQSATQNNLRKEDTNQQHFRLRLFVDLIGPCKALMWAGSETVRRIVWVN